MTEGRRPLENVAADALEPAAARRDAMPRIGRRIRSGGRGAPEAPPDVQRVDSQQRDTGALGLMIDALESPAADDALRELAAAMLLRPDSIREAARGTADLADEPAATAVERAKRRFEETEPDPAALVAAAAVGASPRITEVLRRLGLTPAEVAAQLAELRLRREESGPAGDRVFFATVLNGLLKLTTTVFVVLAALESSGSSWKLLFVIVVWTGYPHSGAALGAVIGCVLALVVSPAAGICHLVGIPADASQAVAERNARLVRTGVHLSLAEQRSVTLRFSNARSRRYQSQRQRVRANLRAVLEGRADGS